jgi:hypothetical protein
MKALKLVDEGAGWVGDHPKTSLFGATILSAFLSYGNFHAAGDHTDQRVALLASASSATGISRTYEGHAAHLSREAEHDYQAGHVRKGYREMARAQDAAVIALHHAQVASHDAVLADQQLGDHQGDENWGLVFGGLSGVLLASDVVIFFRT